jgi:hypothetical protein
LEIATVENIEFTGVEYRFSQKELGELLGSVGFLYNISNFLCEFIMPTFLGGGGRKVETVQFIEIMRHKAGGCGFVSWYGCIQ